MKELSLAEPTVPMAGPEKVRTSQLPAREQSCVPPVESILTSGIESTVPNIIVRPPAQTQT
jgi:hypothetical protein